MRIPEFKPSKRFLGEINLPCLVAKLKNSKLPGVAVKHIEETKDDPNCKIYLRGKNPEKISSWQQKILGQLFLKEGLASAIEDALTEYGKDRNAYCDDEERREIEKNGFAPFIWISVIVIDDIKKEVIMKGGSNWSVHIPEHGLSVFCSKKRWRWGEADDFYRYQAEFEKKEPTTSKQYAKSLAKEIKAMTAQLKEMVAGPEEQERRWNKMFPLPPPGTPIKKDPSVFYGDWKLDVAKTARVLERLGEKESVASCQRKWGTNFYRISKEFVTLHQGEDIIDEWNIRGCKHHGNRVTMLYRDGLDERREFWCDGKHLVDDVGLAYLRVKQPSREIQTPKAESPTRKSNKGAVKSKEKHQALPKGMKKFVSALLRRF